MGRLATTLVPLCLGAAACTTLGGAPDVLPAYAVTYRIEADDVVSTEEHLVRRPYEARSLLKRDGEFFSGRLTNLDGSWFYSTGTMPGWAVLEAGPHRAAPDPRPLAVLEHAREAGLVEVIGADRVLGRECTLIRSGGGLREDLAPPASDDHAELCVDADGIVLREVRVRRGKIARTTEATDLDPAPEIPDDAFVPSPRGGDFPVRADAREGLEENLRVRLDPPGGFAYDGASPKLVATGIVGEGAVGGGVLQRYVRGAELLELDHAPPSSRGGPAVTVVEIPGARRGTLTLDLSVSSLHVPLGDGVAVRLLAADPDVLIEAATGLRRVR